jgi:hypothetical protein
VIVLTYRATVNVFFFFDFGFLHDVRSEFTDDVSESTGFRRHWSRFPKRRTFASHVVQKQYPRNDIHFTVKA